MKQHGKATLRKIYLLGTVDKRPIDKANITTYTVAYMSNLSISVCVKEQFVRQF